MVVGKNPVSLLSDKCRYSKLLRFPISEGIAPLRSQNDAMKIRSVFEKFPSEDGRVLSSEDCPTFVMTSKMGSW